MMLLNPYRFAVSGGGGSGAYRYWRLYVTANDGDSSYISFSEIELLNDTTDLTTGLGASCSQSGGGGVGPAADGVDDNQTTECGSGGAGSLPGVPYTWQIDLGSDQEVTSMTLRSQRVVTGRTPTTFKLQGSASSSGPWTDVIAVTGSTGWGIQEQRTFAV